MRTEQNIPKSTPVPKPDGVDVLVNISTRKIYQEAQNLKKIIRYPIAPQPEDDIEVFCDGNERVTLRVVYRFIRSSGHSPSIIVTCEPTYNELSAEAEKMLRSNGWWS